MTDKNKQILRQAQDDKKSISLPRAEEILREGSLEVSHDLNLTTNYSIIEKAIQYIEENFKSQPSLDEIANSLGMSKFHFQRVFKDWVGISPKKFIQFLTLEYTKEVLKKSKDLFNATFESGLSSTSRLYELFENIEAVTPSEYLSDGNNLTIYYEFYESQFGKCLICVTDKGLCRLDFVLENEDIALENVKKAWPKSKLVNDGKKTGLYFSQIFKPSNFQTLKPLNLLLKGTNFQIQVWKALLAIPEGGLVSYGDIAKYIGLPKSARAVGNAVGDNPIAFLIPCHRVIKETGLIGHYSGGHYRKRAILGWEAARILSN